MTTNEPKWSLRADWLIAPVLPGFCSMKRLGVFLLPLDGMLVHRRSFPRNLLGYPNNLPVPICTPGWREALWELSVLLKNTTQCPRPGLEPGPLAPGTSALTTAPRCATEPYQKGTIKSDQFSPQICPSERDIVAISGQWLDVTGYQDSRHGFCAWFQNRKSSIWNPNYDFKPKLHDTKFNCHFITSTLKSHNLITLVQDFGQYQYQYQ